MRPRAYTIDMDWRKYISVDSDICHGQPCFKGTRIMVWIILERLAYGDAIAQIRKSYPGLGRKAVQAALFFASRSLEHTRYHTVRA